MAISSELAIIIRARDQASKTIGKVQGKVKGLGSSMSSMKGPALAMGAAVGGAIIQFGRLGDEVQKMSLRTGFSTESLSELRFALEQAGSSIQGFESGIKRQARFLRDAGKGLSTAKDAMRDLGLETKDLVGLSPEKLFETLSRAIADLEDPTQKAALAQEVFGRSGVQLLPLLAEGAEGIERLRQEARDLGIVMSAETAQKAAEMNDAINAGKQVMNAMAIEIGSALAPAITFLARGFQALPGPIQKVIVVAGIFFAAMKFGLLSTKAAFISTGIGAALIALITIFVLVQQNWDDVVKTFLAGFNAIRRVFTTVTDAVFGLYKSKWGWLLPQGPLVKAILFLVANWETIWSAVSTAFRETTDFIVDIYTSKWAWLLPGGQLVMAIRFFKDRWDEIWNAVRSKWNEITDGIVGAYKSKWGWILPGGTLIKGILFIRDKWDEIWNAIRSKFFEVADAIKSKVTEVVNGIQAIIDKAREAIDFLKKLNPVAGVKNVAGAVGNFFNPLQHGTKDFKGGLALLGEVGPELALLPPHTRVIPAKETRQVISNVINHVRQVASTAVNNSQAIGNVSTGTKEISNAVDTQEISNAISRVNNVVSNVVNNVVNNAISNASRSISNVVNRAVNNAQSISNAVNSTIDRALSIDNRRDLVLPSPAAALAGSVPLALPEQEAPTMNTTVQVFLDSREIAAVTKVIIGEDAINEEQIGGS